MFVYCLWEHCSSFKDYGIYASLNQMLAAYRCGEWAPSFLKNYTSSSFEHMHVWCIVGLWFIITIYLTDQRHDAVDYGRLFGNPAVNWNLKIHLAFIFSQNSHFVEKNITSNFIEIHQFWKHKHRILTMAGQGEKSSYSVLKFKSESSLHLQT